MKNLVVATLLFTFSFTHSPWALALSLADARLKLGFSTAAKPSQLTEETINGAYKRLIRLQLPQVMSGSLAAVAASQEIAEARRLLLSSMETSCNNQLKMERLSMGWLGQLFPDIFPATFNPFDSAQMEAILPKLARNPEHVLESFQFLEAAPNASLQFRYQYETALALGKYLRTLRLSEPDVVGTFEYEVMAKLFELDSEDLPLNRFLHVLHTLNLNSLRIQQMLIPMLQDPRVDIRQLAGGILKAAGRQYGIAPSLEQPLLNLRNGDALDVLVSSKKSLGDSTYETMLTQLPLIQDEHVLKSVSQTMIAKPEWRRATLDALRAIRGESSTGLIVRLYAAQQLIDANFDRGPSEEFVASQLANAIGDELFQLDSWCRESASCSPKLGEAIRLSRLHN